MSERLVTVFGGGGFVGRYIVQALLRSGVRVRIAERHPKRAWFLKAQGNLGQVQFCAADITRPETLAAAVSGADAVINLVGILKGDFDAVQRGGAANVAAAAKTAGAKDFIQMSAIGADAQSPSRYGRSKGEGEAAVRAVFPRAIIMRPSIIFGREDGFVNKFAQMIGILPIVPVIRGVAKFQPVFVGDVARAVAEAVAHPERHQGKTYALGGPEVFSMSRLNAWIAQTTGRKRFFIDVPDIAAKLMAQFTGFLPGAPITGDQWLMLQQDNVVEPGEEGLDALGIRATPLETVAPGWLTLYTRHGRFGTKAGQA
jgi:uncharacterized protein YbjT (DUF2867 family)